MDFPVTAPTGREDRRPRRHSHYERRDHEARHRRRGRDLPGHRRYGALYFTAVRDARLDHWRRGVAPLISVHDCARAVRLIDQAYARAPAR